MVHQKLDFKLPKPGSGTYAFVRGCFQSDRDFHGNHRNWNSFTIYSATIML